MLQENSDKISSGSLNKHSVTSEVSVKFIAQTWGAPASRRLLEASRLKRLNQKDLGETPKPTHETRVLPFNRTY